MPQKTVRKHSKGPFGIFVRRLNENVWRYVLGPFKTKSAAEKHSKDFRGRGKEVSVMPTPLSVPRHGSQKRDEHSRRQIETDVARGRQPGANVSYTKPGMFPELAIHTLPYARRALVVLGGMYDRGQLSPEKYNAAQARVFKRGPSLKSKQPKKSHAQIKREVDEILAGRHNPEYLRKTMVAAQLADDAWLRGGIDAMDAELKWLRRNDADPVIIGEFERLYHKQMRQVLPEQRLMR